MKIKPNYVLHQVMSFYIVVEIGNEAKTPNRILSLNETGAFLWRIMEKEGGATRKDLIEVMIREYNVDIETAAATVNTFLKILRERALITE